MNDDLITFRCYACRRTFDYHQIEYKCEFYCSDTCLAKIIYTKDQLEAIYPQLPQVHNE